MRIASILLVASCACVGARADEPPAFDGSRAALEIPDAVWERVLADAGRTGGRIGYTADEMRAFGKDTHLLRTVEGLFRDVRRIPRETGRITDQLLESVAKPSEVVARGYALTDVFAGRMYEPTKDLTWGLKELEECATPLAALQKIATKVEGDLTQLPEPVQRLVVRLYVACERAWRWLWIAGLPVEKRQGDAHGQWPPAGFSPEDLAQALRAARAGVGDLHASLRRFLTEEADGQSATLETGFFAYLAQFGRNEAAYGSIVALVHVERALAEYHEARRTSDTGKPERVTLETVFGKVLVLGTGDDTLEIPSDTLISIDQGGNDTWSGHVGASALGRPFGLHVDLAGNDTYTTGTAGTMACGFLGFGALFDLAGDDAYDAKQSGLGCGFLGTGLLYDEAGNDSYRSRGPWGQGCGHAGVGALIDLEGNDDYDCVEQAQGLGGTLGAGLLIDVAGNDTYVARDDGNVSAMYLNQSVAMAQGCGYGRRADIGDGYSLAGGVGILLDGAGDDRYHAQVWAQGCGYWWALGILEDRGGDDQYQNGKYSAGAAAHFAIGVCVDLAGNDVHNANNPASKNQWQGHARDGSIGVFLDGDGDDSYDVNNLCAGAADLNSIGLFWDRRGSDHYTFHDTSQGPANGWSDTGAFGTATRYTPFRSFRDDLPSWGLFLDTGGKDVYGVEGPTPFPPTAAADGTAWKTSPGPRAFGLGYDLEVVK